MKISIITPSLNQARFLPHNLESVWNQSLQPCEQIILDPGSTDGSRDIARRHPHARLVAEPDRGQADAICRGFREAKGEVLAWLNSDDMYAGPGVFAAVAERFNAPDRPDVVYGLVDFVDENNAFVKKGYINSDAASLLPTFHHQVGILQPGVFLKREVFERVGGPPEDMEFTVDYEYWVRIARAGFKWGHLPELLAHHRWWSQMKTASRRDESYLEHLKTVKKHFGYVHHKWAERYAECLVAGTDGIIVPIGGAAVAGQRDAIRHKTKHLLEEFNTDFDSLRLLAASDAPEPLRDTAARMREMGISLEPRGRPFASVPGTTITGFARPQDGNRAVAWRRYYAMAGPEKLTGYEVGDANWLFDRDTVARELQKSSSRIRLLNSNRQRETCVIVGNGPTLNKSDLSLLDQADVIISNFAFYSKALRARATYFTTVNRLVAEQGCHEINHFKGPQKFFPIWLSSHLQPADDTWFLDAILRPEFSKDITDWISWRSTVTFFNLQLAYGLGYRKVLMIGFDHYYRQPEGAREADLIEQKAEDINHFDPNYFRGKKWQAADVGNMEKAYRLAHAAYEADGREIVNCTVGGHLEVFRRGDLAEELRKSPAASTRISTVGTPNRTEVIATGDLPRLLMIDSTPPGSLSATGQLKETFLGDWPKERFLQIWENHAGKPTLHAIRRDESIETSRARPLSLDKLVDLCRAFRPEAVYYRPVDYPLLTQAAETIIGETGAPFAIHMMDDWPERLRETDKALFTTLDASLRRLIPQAAVRWSICEAMSKEYFMRYGQSFEPLANGVDLADFPDHSRHADRTTFQLRYLGALAHDMTAQSVLDIARAVAELQGTVPVQFEIHTMDWCREEFEKDVAPLPGVRIGKAVSGPPYYRLLADSDALVIAYNFDPESIRYVRLSIANKLPECMASGAALLAYGPAEVATISYLQGAGCAKIVDRRDQTLLKQALCEMATQRRDMLALAAKARTYAEHHLSKKDIQRRFRSGILKTASSEKRHQPPSVLPGPYSRDDAAHYDETEALAAYLEQSVQTGTMIDVGAHQGYALAHFLDEGWRIWAFEPDSGNRAALETRLQAHKNAARVTLDARCVNRESASNLPFYKSAESTGISGLSAFRKSHREAQRVDSVSLRDYFRDREMPEVDFLKIDTEGHDLFVLQGFPWDRNKPEVIECEFEDLKTMPLGYTTKDMADFLVGQGYTVYVSEWHPILRYGQRHDWHRLQKYPCQLAGKDAWGNLLAFARRPDELALAEAVKRVLKLHKPAKPQTASVALPHQPSFYSPVFEHSEHFTEQGPYRWSLRRDPKAAQHLLFANFRGVPTKGRKYVGLVILESDQPAKVEISLGRIGTTAYEGSRKFCSLEPGDARVVWLSHTFAADHLGLKLQVDVKEAGQAVTAISMTRCMVFPPCDHTLDVGPPEGSIIREANRLYRKKRYEECIPLYIYGARRMGLRTLAFNVQLALRRLGVHVTATRKALIAELLS